MQITDPIADMLTRIRNANDARHATVDVPASKLKIAIAQILKDEGYIKDFEVQEGNYQGVIRITLKYLGKEKVITGLRRVSKPGLRRHDRQGCAQAACRRRSPGVCMVKEEQRYVSYRQNAYHSTCRR